MPAYSDETLGSVGQASLPQTRQHHPGLCRPTMPRDRDVRVCHLFPERCPERVHENTDTFTVHAKGHLLVRQEEANPAAWCAATFSKIQQQPTRGHTGQSDTGHFPRVPSTSQGKRKGQLQTAKHRKPNGTFCGEKGSTPNA